MYKYLYFIKATTNGEIVRYQTKFKTRKEAQNAIDSLQVSYYQMIKMFRAYSIKYPPRTIYEIVEIRKIP